MPPSLRVLTWNLHTGHRGREPQQADVIAAAGAQLVLLQEVVAGPGHAEVLAQGWPHQVFARARGRRGGGEQGSLVLSRHPIADSAVFDLSNHPWERRVALHVRLHDGVHAVVLHLDLTGLGRQRQLERVRAWIADQVPADAPLILAGDCNDWSRALDHRLHQAGFHEAHRQVYGQVARTWPAAAPLLGLDRIYLRGWRAVAAQRIGARQSDHRGVMADLVPA